ncbi:MAG: hypothetical protein A2885_13565 [Sphingopyxis sp. RIFCSPHIGHO2_01_FULL_65_24]|nr:MAG: hypothetical protein A2885_13565 [Sphingopyxis sp. RIFCSPHIGHO2_01_FULL_65_24]
MGRPAKTRAKVVRKRPPAKLEVSYIFRIERFAPSYALSGGSEWQETTFDEYFSLEFTARCLIPEKYADRLTEFSIGGSRELTKLQSQPANGHKAQGVGLLTFHGKRSKMDGRIPVDAMQFISPQIGLGTIKFIYLIGDPVVRGNASIRWIAFESEVDLERQ